MKKKILTLLLALTAVVGYAQAQKTPPEGYDPNKVVVFSFVVGDDVFMLGLNDNNQRFKEAMSFIDVNKEHIDDGIVSTDHKENMIWNNTLTITWHFGCNK